MNKAVGKLARRKTIFCDKKDSFVGLSVFGISGNLSVIQDSHLLCFFDLFCQFEEQAGKKKKKKNEDS